MTGSLRFLFLALLLAGIPAPVWAGDGKISGGGGGTGTAEDLESSCTDAQVLGGDGASGVECQADDDIPEGGAGGGGGGGDFGNASDLTAAGRLVSGSVDRNSMGGNDFNFFSCSDGFDFCQLDNGAITTLKILDGAVTSAKVDSSVATQAELDTHEGTADAHPNAVTVWHVAFDFGSSITTSQEWVARSWGAATTIDRCECEAYTGTSFGVNVCLGEDTGDDTCTTNIATMTCDTSGASSTGLSQATTARQKLTTVVTAVSGTVTKGEIACYGATQ